MRAVTFVVLALVVLGAAAMWAFGDGVFGPDVAPPLPPGAATDDHGDGATAPVGALPDGVTATRTEDRDIDPGPLADRPTVCLRVIDHGTERPVAGAVVRRLQTGADLAFTDERGLAFVPLEEPAQLSVLHDGYLIRLAPARLGSDEQRPQVVRMLRDKWSSVRRFAFVGPDGRPVADAFARIRVAQRAPLVHNGIGAAQDPVAQRAWSEHMMMAGREVSRDLHVHAGNEDDHVYRSSGEVLVVRFLAAGDYTLEAATTSGLVATMPVTVAVGPEPPVQNVRMQPGAFVRGQVLDTASRPLAAASVSLQGGDPLGLVATSDAAGAFAIGPLVAGTRTLLVRHPMHRPRAIEDVAAPSDGLRVRLEPLERTPLRGRVRARPGLEPIADANVIWQIAGGGAVTARTAADGTFELQAAGTIAARLLIQAPGYVTYAELVDPGAPFADYDLLPAVTDVRVAHGLTATLEGVVFGANGFPLANASVRWRPATGASAPGLPGRRVLEGGLLELPNVTTTDSAGAFVLETTSFGRGTLSANGGDGPSLETTAVAGKRVQGIELKP